MAVPKKRKSRARRDMRRAQNDRMPALHLGVCPKCGAAKRSHRVCRHCGYYKGREVVRMVEA